VRFEARRCNTGGADGDHGVDISSGELRTRQRFLGDVDKQRLGALEEGLGAFRPAARFEIPLERLYAVALDDPGVRKNA
jgi:hypothetical protein